MKKTFATAAALLLAASLSACSSSEAAPAANNETGSQESTAPEASESHSVVYEVTGDSATAGNVTYMTATNGNVGTEQANGAPLPFTKEIILEDKGLFEANVFSLTAMTDDAGTSISCKITVDGEVIAEQTSTGQYAMVSCSGS